MLRASVRLMERGTSPPCSVNELSFLPATDSSEVSVVRRVKQTWEKLSSWALFEPYVPSLASWSNCSTKDRIIGLTLHCFILSAMVLGVVLAKASWFCIKFFCFVLINYAVFRGDVVEPITEEQIQDATIFDSSGLKIILLQSRGKRMPTPISTMTPLHTYESGSDSSQDIFSISSHH